MRSNRQAAQGPGAHLSPPMGGRPQSACWCWCWWCWCWCWNIMSGLGGVGALSGPGWGCWAAAAAAIIQLAGAPEGSGRVEGGIWVS